MNSKSENNKRIAKNTIVLYVRMLFLMAINLYASRVVLATLGVTDYGIYNAVGGFVAMFHVINGAMSTATQRFLSFEIGTGDDEKITKIFSTAIVIHVLLALIIMFVAETVGIWFLNEKMQFPPDRYVAANLVFQLSILTLMINVISVPYNAALVAYEKMSAFAYISIIEGILKLLIVYLVVIMKGDKLVLYAFFISLIAIGIRCTYGLYVNRHLPTCRNNWRMEKSVRKEMMSFVSWNLIGSTAGIVQQQGLSVLLNIFFGAAINAARGISIQVLHAVSGFVSNFNLAMNPQIIKSYASGHKEEMFNLAIRGSKFSYMLMLLLSAPIIIETPYLLNLWLVEVPENSVLFARVILLIALTDSMKHTMVASVHASGKVKLYQLTNGIFALLTIPVAYVVLRLGYPPVSALITSLVFSIICHFIRLLVLWKIVRFPVGKYLKTVTFRMFVISLLSLSIPIYVYKLLPQSFISFLVVCVITLISTGGVCFILGLSSTEKNFISNKIMELLNRFSK